MTLSALLRSRSPAMLAPSWLVAARSIAFVCVRPRSVAESQEPDPALSDERSSASQEQAAEALQAHSQPLVGLRAGNGMGRE